MKKKDIKLYLYVGGGIILLVAGYYLVVYLNEKAKANAGKGTINTPGGTTTFNVAPFVDAYAYQLDCYTCDETSTNEALRKIISLTDPEFIAAWNFWQANYSTKLGGNLSQVTSKYVGSWDFFGFLSIDPELYKSLQEKQNKLSL